MKNSFFSRFTPQEPKFFPMLKRLSEILTSSSDLLVESMQHDKPEEREDYYKRIKDMEREGDKQTHLIFDELGKTIVPELKVLYPSVKTVSISHAIELSVDSIRPDTITLAVLKFGKHPGVQEKEKITEWLKARTGAKRLRLIAE